jgi:hypothetical protein
MRVLEKLLGYITDVLVLTCSDFKDIFDVEHFKKTLEGDISIVDSLPLAYKGLKLYMRAPTSWAKVWTNHSSGHQSYLEKDIIYCSRRVMNC